MLLLCISSYLAAGQSQAHQRAQFCCVLQMSTLSPALELCPSWSPAISCPVWIPKATKMAQRLRKPLHFSRGFSKLDFSLLCKASVRYMAQQVPSIKRLFLSRPNCIDRMCWILPYNQLLQSFPVGAAYFGLAPDHVRVLGEHRGQRHSTVI